MKVQIQKWGNSLALRIPKSFAIETNITQGSMVDVTLREDGILLKSSPSEITLDSLLEEITVENTHSEVDFGERVGDEVW